MCSVRQWIATWMEWGLVGFGLGCLGAVSYATLDAHRFQTAQAAAFTRVAESRAADTELQSITHIEQGGLVGMLELPRLGLATPVISGDDEATLRRSVGHLPDTPLPWHAGNSALAGHRDTLFRPLKDVAIGDEILFRSVQEDLRYRVTQTLVVEPDDLSVLESRADASSLTLITCYPFYYVGAAPQRFIVHAERLDPPAPANRD
jgi:sortase A